MTRIEITPVLFASIDAIQKAGHSVGIERAPDSTQRNRFTRTDLIIGVRHPDEAAYVHKLRIRLTESASEGWHTFTAVDPHAFGELAFGECSLAELLERISARRDEWRAAQNADPLGWNRRSARA